MSKPIQLQIPTPCHESWSDMKKTDCGRFCSSCQKEVVDFSLMSDSEIFSYFTNAKDNTCGRFSTDQLNRNISKPRERKLGWFRYFIHVMIPAMILVNKSYAQGLPRKKIETVQTQPSKSTHQLSVEKSTARVSPHKRKLKKIIWKPTADSNGNFHVSEKDNERVSLATRDEYQTLETTPRVVKGFFDEDEMETRTFRKGGLVSVICIKNDTTIVSQIRNFFRSQVGSGAEAFNVYPNPVSTGSVVNLSFDRIRSGNYLVSIFSMAGQSILQKQITIRDVKSVEEIHLNSNFRIGTYSVRVMNIATKKVFISKLVVE